MQHTRERRVIRAVVTQKPLVRLLAEKRLSESKPSLGLNKLLQYLLQLEERLARLGDEAETLGLISNARNAFNMVFNSIRITAEAIDHYERDWPNHIAGFSDEKVKKTYDEFIVRIGEITKSSLIRTLSYIEYAAKEKIRTSTDAAFSKINNALSKGEPVNLSWIINASMTNGLVDFTTQKEWEGIIELRNCMVHNNGFAEFTETYRVAGMTLDFQKGKNLRFDIGIFASLIEIAMILFINWLRKV